MNRRTSLAVAVIGFNLMACCCGGFGPAKGPRPQQPEPAQPVAVVTPAKPKPQVTETPEPERKSTRKNIKATGVIEPIAEKKPPAESKPNAEESIRQKYAADLVRRPMEAKVENVVAKPIEIKNLKSSINGVSVEIVSAAVGPFTYFDKVGGKKSAKYDMLILKLKVTNNSSRHIYYLPWHTAVADSPEMRDDLKNPMTAWRSGKNGVAWPDGGVEQVTEVRVGKSIIDILVFGRPRIESEAYHLRLAPVNVQQKSDTLMKFDFSRSFFESKEARAASIVAENAKRLADETARLKKIEDDRIAAIEKEMNAELAAYKKKVADEEAVRLAAEAKAEEERLAGVTRVNYNKLRDEMTFKEVRAILGPDFRENASGSGVSIVTWERGIVFKTTIRCTFQNGRLKIKSIVGN